ncbi:MAG: alpha/beta hydrolase [Chloracidobacterium sp.]|nr:alpha/beta hydrolase [Chloracidobacterium sp.]MCC6824447.1 alpha/beta hydrolase [Acidobacteriota bacterium]MCO5332715.1 alpha/beta hydrolase [Pyrinomonadaceae bacterium]
MRFARLILLAAILSALSVSSSAQDTVSVFAAEGGARYRVTPDIVYNTANNTPLKLDVWYPSNISTPTKTLVYYHGGGWVFGAKAYSILYFLPFLEKGWRVVDVEYRMASNSLAPAAVEDTRCALRWVFRNAKQYNFDTSKIVLTGHSAGGHLALISGMLPEKTPLDNACFADEKYGDTPIKIAAIVNWFGISDVADLTHGPDQRNYAMMWIGAQKNADEIAKDVSPLTYVRAGLPPILTLHGDKDDVVPYTQATRLRDALNRAGVKNDLHTISGGGHGQFTREQYIPAWNKVFQFLKENGID